MRRLIFGAALAPLLLLGACASQPADQPPPFGVASAASPWADREGWQTQLGDPAVDRLASAGLADNPTLAEAAARVDQARAVLDVQAAARLPGVSLEAGLQGARDRPAPGQAALVQTKGSLGLGLSWELDLWGRVREGVAAADRRLASAAAEADAARLSLTAQIADTTLALRACEAVLATRDADIASREVEMAVAQARLASGGLAPVAVATAASNLAAARTERIAQDEACRRLVHALAALSGVDNATIGRLIAQPATTRPPPFSPTLPAAVLLAHPVVVAAEREAAARWSEIAVARAERLPRIDLAAALSGQWIRALGATTSTLARSGGLSLAGPVFDGGAGVGRVKGAQARYDEASARLEGVVRTAVRDVEDALAAQQSALARQETSRQAAEAARLTFDANTARWRAGAIAPVELEESRRQFNRAQESAITAASDQARAWVALVRATGAAS